MSLTEHEYKFYLWWADIRAIILKPFAVILTRLGVTPNMITYAGTICMVLFVIFIKRDIKLSLVFVIATYFLDLLDGAMARYVKQLSDKGKFIDSFADHINYAILTAGLVYAGITQPLLTMLALYFVLMDTVIRAIHKSPTIQSDWHFKIFSGPLPGTVMHMTYVLFFVFVVFKRNYLDIFFYIALAALLIDILVHYILIRRSKKEKRHNALGKI